jgi:hypothetical protein
MEGLTKFDAIYVALVFIVPGYIFLNFRNQFVAGQGRLGKEQLLSYLTISGVNFILCGWLVYFSYSYDMGVPWKMLAWILVIAVFPAAAGILSGTVNKREIVRKLYRKAGLEPVHTIPTAWDYKFSKSPGEWIFVTLKNGTRFAGWWSGASFASDQAAERDLFVEQVFDFDETGPWQPTSKSLLIVAGEISTIEFIRAPEIGE